MSDFPIKPPSQPSHVSAYIKDKDTGYTVEIEDLSDEARSYLQDSIPENTRKALQSDWRSFLDFCREDGRSSLPATPETVIEYMTSMAEEYQTSTISRHLSSIRRIHEMMGMQAPTLHTAVKSVWKGIRRRKGKRQEGKSPLLLAHVKRIVMGLDDSLCGIRNRALLLVGFYAGLRRSELCALQMEDIEMTEEGISIYIKRSKTDQEGEGRTVAIPENPNKQYCAKAAIENWIAIRGEKDGPLWYQTYKNRYLVEHEITSLWVSILIKKWCRQIGLDASFYSGHSLRTGLVTTLAQHGVDLFDIQRHVGHEKVETTLRYVREADRFKKNPLKKLDW